MKSSWVAFKTPQMSAPPFEGKLDAAERQALTQISANLPTPQTSSVAGTVAVRRALIFAGFGGLLAFLWFAVPLLFWPSPKKQIPGRQDSISPSGRRIVPHLRGTLAASATGQVPISPASSTARAKRRFNYEAHDPLRIAHCLIPVDNRHLFSTPIKASRRSCQAQTEIQVRPGSGDIPCLPPGRARMRH